MHFKKPILNTRSALFALALSCNFYLTNAAPIEQIGDRYIVHVPELDLRGDESLMDILLMCPDVITINGNTPLNSEALANMYGRFVIRFDNVEYGLDYNTLLHNLKAQEIEKIQICLHTEVMKGTGGQKKVIDIHLRKDKTIGGDNKKISGRQGMFGDTYGGAESITSLRYHGDNMQILGHLEGNMLRSDYNDGSIKHRSHEGAKATMSWDISPNDNLLITATQTYTRDHITNTPVDYTKFYSVEADYTRTLADNGASVLLTLATDHEIENESEEFPSNENQSTIYHNRFTYPVGILEFNFPLFYKDLWITAGMEGGLAIEEYSLESHTIRSNYTDFYAQADLTLGKWGFMVGDRFRRGNFPQYTFSHYNAYTLSAYHHFNEHRTLQLTYSRQFFNAVMFAPAQTPVHITELKHTYCKKSLILSSVLRYISQNTTAGHVHTLNFNNTLFWHVGMLRLTAGTSCYQEMTQNTLEDGSKEKNTSRFFVFKLAPQLSLPCDWRLTSTLLWSTHRNELTPSYEQAYLYAEAAIYKTLGKHWLLEGRYHDIAGQMFGNRAATFGCTYYF